MPPNLDLLAQNVCEIPAEVQEQMSNNTERNVPPLIPPTQASRWDAAHNETNAKLDIVGNMFPQRVGVTGRVDIRDGGEHGRSTTVELDLSDAEAADAGEAHDVHGMQYPPRFLESLPVMHPPVSSYTSPAPSPPRTSGTTLCR